MSTARRVALPNVPWFQRWFDSSHYHRLYGNRDENEAAGFVNELVGHLQPAPGSSMLDLGCGAGRHSRQLASKGYVVTGIDLASSSIREAKKAENGSLHFYRHDMREPFGNDRFDYIFNFFTSFGYFKTSRDNDRVLSNIFNALKPGGTLVLDYLNVHYAEARLVPSQQMEIDGIEYHITRWTDDRFFYKKIVVEDGQMGEPFENTEQVSKFGLEDFRQMFSNHQLHTKEVYGDYGLNSYDSSNSPRLIIIAKK